jgi:hypothetical protein
VLCAQIEVLVPQSGEFLVVFLVLVAALLLELPLPLLLLLQPC